MGEYALESYVPFAFSDDRGRIADGRCYRYTQVKAVHVNLGLNL